MKKNLKFIKVSLVLLVMINLTGCFSFAKTPPQIKYMFNIPCQKYTKGPAYRPSLQVGTIKIAPAYSGTEFVYKINSLNYITDYYHSFFIPADQQIGAITTCYLSSKQIFSNVGDDLNPINRPTYILLGSVNALYANYQNSRYPQAVISIRYRLLNQNARVVMDKTYYRSILLPQKTSVALVKAWTEGLRGILYALNLDLKAYTYRAASSVKTTKHVKKSMKVATRQHPALDLIT